MDKSTKTVKDSLINLDQNQESSKDLADNPECDEERDDLEDAGENILDKIGKIIVNSVYEEARESADNFNDVTCSNNMSEEKLAVLKAPEESPESVAEFS